MDNGSARKAITLNRSYPSYPFSPIFFFYFSMRYRVISDIYILASLLPDLDSYSITAYTVRSDLVSKLEATRSRS